MSKVAIKAENLSKAYQLGEFSTGTLSRDIERWWAQIRGKEDPFLKVGETNDRTSKGSSDIVWSLKDINFEINQGDAVGIIGRNGAGKSTLLKVLSRVTSPTTGNIKVKGRIASLLEVGTGFHPELTGRENIFLNGAILGMRKTEIKKHFDAIVDFAGVERYIDTPVKRYSSGMYVRLAFAVAAHLESEILIVDEVLAVGDAEFQKKCLGKMGEVSKGEGRTVLFVSHNMGSIIQLCDKGVLLKNGQLHKIAGAKEIVQDYIKSEETNNEYRVDSNSASKQNYFLNIAPVNDYQEKTTDFKFEEGITLTFSFAVRDYSSDLQIGIGLNDKYQNRIFTILKEIDFFKQENGIFTGAVKLPSNLIAPNNYSFTFAIWTRGGKIYDHIENIFNIKIHETGSDFAIYEGNDYGSFIIKPEWTNVY